MRALRILFADVSDLRAVGKRDGFAARANLPDEDGVGRQSADDTGMGATHRYVPRMRSMHDGVSIRSGLRQADRGDASPGRTKLSWSPLPWAAVVVRAAAPENDFCDVPAAGTATSHALAPDGVSAVGFAMAGAAVRLIEAGAKTAARDGDAASSA